MVSVIDYIYMGLILLFSLSIHESAHAYAAHRLGDDTARMLGRISLNPIRHADPFGTVLIPAILIISGSGILFGWAKPVPVNPLNLKNPVRDFGIVAFAGPLSNIIAAMGAFILLKFAILAHLGQGAINFLYFLMAINVILALFNLIPVHPLDGGSVLMALLPPRYRHITEPLRQYGFIILIVLIFATDIFGTVIRFVLTCLTMML